MFDQEKLPQFRMKEMEKSTDRKIMIWIFAVIVIGFIGAISLYWQILSAIAFISAVLIDILCKLAGMVEIELVKLVRMEKYLEYIGQQMDATNKRLDTIATALSESNKFRS